MKATTAKAFEAYIYETMSARGWITGSNQSAFINAAVTGKIDVSTEFTLSNVEGLNTGVRESI